MTSLLIVSANTNVMGNFIRNRYTWVIWEICNFAFAVLTGKDGCKHYLEFSKEKYKTTL